MALPTGRGRGFNAQANAFPLAFFRGPVGNHLNRKILRQGGNLIAGGNKKDLSETIKTADQVQGMPRQGLAPERNQELVLAAKTPGKPEAIRMAKTSDIPFIVIEEWIIVSYCPAQNEEVYFLYGSGTKDKPSFKLHFRRMRGQDRPRRTFGNSCRPAGKSGP
jgi:hypothetical protein